MNIVIPMAGAGSRFSRAGYVLPKPLIAVHGMPMIEVVVRNLQPKIDHRFIFIVQRQHLNEFGLEARLTAMAPGCVIVAIDGLTRGAACTVLAAKHHIDCDVPLMIANSDQYIDANIDDYLSSMRGDDGFIMTMNASDPKWSFVGRDSAGKVDRVVEKEVVSDEATVGIYNFARGSAFVSAAENMINSDIMTNGEFYVGPAYNMMIAQGGSIGTYTIGADRQGMYGLGTPADLEYFAGLEISRNATSRRSP